MDHRVYDHRHVDQPYDQAQDPEPAYPLPGWPAVVVMLVAPLLLVAAGGLAYAGGLNVHRGQIVAGVVLGVAGVLGVVALWVRGERG